MQSNRLTSLAWTSLTTRQMNPEGFCEPTPAVDRAGPVLVPLDRRLGIRRPPGASAQSPPTSRRAQTDTASPLSMSG
jgi:hypothetical protein